MVPLPQGMTVGTATYVANELSNNVSVINRTTVVGTVAVGNQPEGVGYDNRSGYIYVANFGSNNVSVINGTTVVATIPVGIYPIGVAYDSGNGYVYVANQGSNNVSVINQTTVVATVPVGNNPLAWRTTARTGSSTSRTKARTPSALST